VINPIGASSHFEKKKEKIKTLWCEGKDIDRDFVLLIKMQPSA
jgi:hypothetical protein